MDFGLSSYALPGYFSPGVGTVRHCASYSPDVCIDGSGFLVTSQRRHIGMLSLPTLLSQDALLKKFLRSIYPRLFSPGSVRLQLRGRGTSHLAWRIHILHTSVALLHGATMGNHFLYVQSLGVPRFRLSIVDHGLWQPRKLSARVCARDVSSTYIW